MTTTDILANLVYILPRLNKEQQETLYQFAVAFDRINFDKINKEREDSHGDS